MQQKRRFWQSLTQRLDIPREALPGGFGLTASGARSVTVSGCRRILAYGDACIRLAVGKREVLTVEGEGLLCTVFRAGSVTVEGRLSCLRFEREGREDC